MPINSRDLATWVAAADWGDVPTWLNAIVTTGALVAAAIAARAAWAVLGFQRDTESKRGEAEERAAQADLVAAWHDTWRVGRSATLRSRGAVLLNQSPLPVYELTVAFLGPDNIKRASVTLPVVPPGEQKVSWPYELRTPAGQDEHRVPLYVESLSEFSVAIDFRDTAGRLWYRDRDGRLTLTGWHLFGEAAVQARSSLSVGRARAARTRTTGVRRRPWRRSSGP